jgi:hypothetical protein
VSSTSPQFDPVDPANSHRPAPARKIHRKYDPDTINAALWENDKPNNLPPEPDPAEQDLSAELATPSGDFLTQIDINHVLGNLFQLLAANRISTKRAGSLANICVTLLKSHEGMHDQVRFLEWTANKWAVKLLREEYGPPPKSPAKPSPHLRPNPT